MMIVDGAALHVYGFNYTKLDIDKSRSFGIVTRDKKLVAGGGASCSRPTRCRQTYTPGAPAAGGQPGELARAADRASSRAREEAAADLRRAGQRQRRSSRCCRSAPRRASRSASSAALEKATRGVKVAQAAPTCGCTSARSSATAASAFIGSQSLRKLELEGRREVGVIVNERRASSARSQRCSRRDWQKTSEAARRSPKAATTATSRPASIDRPSRSR